MATQRERTAQARVLVSEILSRLQLEDISTSGRSFRGKRDIYRALGYQRVLKPSDYRGRYERGGIAKRIVEAFPVSTWRGGGELVEDEDPDIETQFESDFDALNTRLGVWSIFQRTDILAGLGRFAIILIGAPGALNVPLEKCTAENLKYLTPFSERDVVIEKLETEETDPRFGLPTYYSLQRINPTNLRSESFAAQVHYSRVIHIADGVLDHPLYGTPRLRNVWNYLDDLDKVVGGGSEAFWKRVDGGKQFNLDPTLNITQPELDALKAKIEDYTHDLERNLTTRGVEIKDLGSDVSSFQQNVSSIVELISATTGIPQRILMGSERGELASSTDQSNYDDRVQDRRNEFAGPQVVRPVIDRFIELGVLPKPVQYEPRWPDMDDMDELEKMALAKSAAEVNQAQGDIVITPDEIRDRILGWPPLSDVIDTAQLDDLRNPKNPIVDPNALPPTDPNAVPKAAGAKRLRLMRLSTTGKTLPKWARSAA